MIEVYTAPTPNSRRVTITLELCGLDYVRHEVDLAKGEHKTARLAKVNPAMEIPVLIDPDGPGDKTLCLSQSGAICLYLAEKAKRLMPASPVAQVEASQWFWHAVTDMGGMAATIFRCHAVDEGESLTCSAQENRLVRHINVVERQLEERQFLAGELSIADAAMLPVFLSDTVKPLLNRAGDVPNLARWTDTMLGFEEVVRGL